MLPEGVVMRRVAWLVVVVVSLVTASCASAPTSTTVLVNPSNVNLERIEVFDSGPIR